MKISYSAKPYKSILKKQMNIPAATGSDEISVINQKNPIHDRPKSPKKTPRMDKKKSFTRPSVKPIKSNATGSKQNADSPLKQKKKLGKSLIESVNNIKKQTEEVQKPPQTPKKTPLSVLTKSKQFTLKD